MMRANISTRDYESLSAYIDGQLSPREKRKLEDRLRAHEDLRNALEEMRQTRMLLRHAPHRRAPRNFTLTPAMVREPERKPASFWNLNLFPALSVTSALAAFVLVVLVALQLTSPGRPAQTVAMQPSAAQEAAPSAKMAAETEPAQSLAAPAAAPTESPAESLRAQPQATEEVEAPMGAMAMPNATQEAAQPQSETEATVPPIINWNNPYANQGPYGMGSGGAGGMGGGGDGGPMVGPLLGPPPAPETAPQSQGIGGGQEAPPQVVPPGGLALPPESANSLDQTAEPVPTSTPGGPAESNASPILGVPEAGQGGQIVEKRAILGLPDEQPTATEGPSVGALPAATAAPTATPFVEQTQAAEDTSQPEAAAVETQPNAEPTVAVAQGQPAEGQRAMEEQPAELPAKQQDRAAEPGAQQLVQPATGLVLGLDPRLLIVLEITLAALAAGAGVSAYFVRRRRNR